MITGRPAVAIVALASGFVLFAIGLSIDQTWAEIEPARVQEWSKIAAFLLAVAAVGARLLRIAVSKVLLLLVAAASCSLLGVAGTVSLVVLALGATALGDLVVPETAPDRGLLSLSIGLCVLAAIIGWSLPIPLHKPIVYWVVAVAMIAWRRASLIALVRQGAADLQSTLVSSRFASCSALLVAGIAVIPALLPLLGFDDLAYHLRMPGELAELGYARLDVQSQVWSVAPWAGDVLAAVLTQLSGQPTGASANVLWFSVALITSFRLASHFGAGPRLAWWSVALYASLPFTTYVTGTLQSEMASTALLGVLCLVVARAGASPDAFTFRSFVLLLAGLAAFKASNGMIVIPVIAWLLCKWRLRLPMTHVLPTMIIAVFIAGSSYAYGAYLTGNPLLPLFNGIFHSPFYGNTNFYDAHWASGVTPALPWRLLFDTTKYGEVWDGAAGFSMLLMGGAWLLATARRETRAFALVAAATWMAPLLAIQYARYAYPGMLLLVPASVVGIAALERRVWIDLVMALVVAINVAFQSNAHWLLRDGYVMRSIMGDRDRVAEAVVPEVAMSRFVRETLPSDSRILFADAARPYTGILPDKSFALSWYDPNLDSQDDAANTDPTGSGWLKLLEETGTTHVAIFEEKVSPGLSAALALRGYHEVFRSGGISLQELRPAWGRGLAAVDSNGTVRSTFQLDRAGSALVRAFVELRCSKSGAYVATSWRFESSTGKSPEPVYKWVPCRHDGVARDEWNSSLFEGQGTLSFEANAAQPGVRVDLTPLEQGAWVRNDLISERDQARKLRRSLRSAVGTQ